MTRTEIVKRLIGWPLIRRRKILHGHARAVEICHKYLEEKNPEDFVERLMAVRPQLKGKRIIWQYWGQGFEEVPELVRVCLASVDRWRGSCTLIRLDESNIKDYILIPKDIRKALDKLSRAAWSDVLRMCLLTLYGGCWLDATVFLTSPLPERYWNMPLFMFQRDDKEPDKKYWENAFAHYFGWGKEFRVNVLSSIIFAKPDNPEISEFTNLLLNLDILEEKFPHYFIPHILYDVIRTEFHKDCVNVESDCIPHWLQQYMNDPKFFIADFEEILRKTGIHKLTYKNEGSDVKIKTLFPEYADE